MSLKQIFTIICFLLLAVSISAQVPNTINYQGRLTDASGSPVADGAYLVKFIIYDAAVGGADLWNTGFQNITTNGGLFTYELGSNIALPAGIFDDTTRYLGITVGTDAELFPRSKLNTVPYASKIDGSKYVSTIGDTMSGSLVFQNGGNTRGIITSESNVGTVKLFGFANLLNAYLIAGSFGEFLLYDNNGTRTVDLGAGYNTGGYLSLSDPIGAEDIYLNTRAAGNSTVLFPNNAIDNTEILDEPGIASNHSSSLKTFTTTMQDLVTVSITIPTSGYIYVTGRSWVRHNAMTGYNVAVLQIDETAGGALINPYYNLSGPISGTNNQIVYPFFVDRVYFKNAGTYTFRLEGMGGATGTDIDAYNHWITAMFTPTSYGSVAASSPLPPTDAEAEMVTSTNLDGSTSQVYKYDLRDLELKAKATALKAKEAELELLKAKQQQNANQ